MINLKEFKQSVLQKAMQGKLTKQLPSDGNTSDLLIKIANKKRELYQAGELKKSETKPLPPITDKEKPSFKIPDNWEWTRLSTITSINLGKTPPKKNSSYWNNGTIPWVSVSDLDNNIIKNTKNKITKKASKDVFKNKMIPKGSLLMSFKLSIGKMGILGISAYHNEAIASFQLYIGKSILKHYLYLFLPIFTKFVPTTSAVKGKTLNKSKLKKMIIPLPPLSEQKRIVAKVNKCFELADTIQKERELNKKFAHDMKQSLLMEAMQGKLTKQRPSDGNADKLLQKIQQKKQALIKVGKIHRHKKLPLINKKEIPFKIPKNWEWVRLQDICNYVQKGKSPKYSKIGYPILNQKCIRWGGINFNFHKNISSDVFNTFNKHRLLKVGDILWNTTGTGTLGRLSIVTNDLLSKHHQIVVNGDVMIIRSNKKIDSMYLLKFLSSPIIQKYLDKIITGSTKQIHLNLSVVLPLLIPLPPLAEQRRIINKLNHIFINLGVN